ncbi:MAG TPA: VOC family protein, partial [Actinomycetota bacterium]|nr:VOC family protein [Actinomycetota bacterium]
MPEVDRHEPGFFCWTDLSTSDLEGATTFYTSLFGWDTDDQSMGEGDPYRTFKANGRSVAAAYTQRDEQKAAGVPPSWSTYVSVNSAD